MVKKRGKEYGEPRKRGFDDDFEFDSWKKRDNRRSGGSGSPSSDYNFAGASGGGFSAPTATGTGPVSTASVSWFNSEKGFGFVSVENNGGDAFLHASTLEATGKKTVAPGATIKCRLGQGQKGRQVTEIISIDESTASSTPARSSGPRAPREGGGGHSSPYGSRDGGGGSPRGGPRGFAAVDTSNAVEIGGVVKWYNGEKGFGFINADDGGKDVFVHVSALQRSNLVGLDPDQKIRMKVIDGAKGREAVELSRA